MTIRVAFDTGDLSLKHGGITPYATRLIRAFEQYELPDDIDLTIVSKDPPLMSKAERWVDSMQWPLRQVGLRDSTKTPTKYRSMRQFWRSFDLYHSSNQVTRTKKLPQIVTMHDVQELHFPQYFSSAERESRAIHHRRVIESAAAVVVSFEHVREDLLTFFDVEPQRVRVIDLPLQQSQLPELSASQLVELTSRIGPSQPYFLYPAQTWPHKNHLRLLEAFAIVQERCPDTRLVCTGFCNEFFEQSIRPRIASLGLDRVVEFRGIVPNDELNYFYRHARGVVVPTRYEAGSFPLIEAMLVEAPVICSDTTSLPKTIGNRQFVFHVDDVDTMADMMLKIHLDEHFRAANIQNSRSRTRQWMSRNVTDQYLDLWRFAAANAT